MKKILVISGDTVNQNMGGVGVRNWELAHALAGQCQVTLAIPNHTDLVSSRVHLAQFDLEGGDLRPLASQADALVTHGFILHFHPYLRETGLPLAIDLYTPFLLESLVWHDRDDWGQWIPAYEEYLRVQLELLRAGDFFICASHRQRDYWLGWLHAQKRINPHTYRQDPTLRHLIDIVPFGLPSELPVTSGPVLKGLCPGISPRDKLILWSGGLWDWLDPLTLIQAVANISQHRSDVKLYFMGTRHPNPVVSGMSMPDQAIALSKSLGVYQTAVFFGDWAPYQERAGYLLEADLGVVSHPGHIETHFSFRTRVLDCIWTGLPLVITEGDAMADLAVSTGIGLAVPPLDVPAMQAALEELLSRDRDFFSDRFASLREALRWDRVIAPLARFCQDPALAPDKGQYLTDLERISLDKDAHLEQVIRDKDDYIASLEMQVRHYQSKLPFRMAAWLRRKLRPS
ncbi:MAG TPA: glycosyltransferase family 4 protein [Anaerolineales bacterium]|nr:glycosyltransferase family 4 protein [Anaerolineales bacterium]